MKMTKFVMLLIIGLLISCEKDVKDEYNKRTQKLKMSYRYKGKRCTTGEQTFWANTKKELYKNLCIGLQNDELNNSCALKKRKKSFKENCKGEKWLLKEVVDINPRVEINEKNKTESEVEIETKVETEQETETEVETEQETETKVETTENKKKSIRNDNSSLENLVAFSYKLNPSLTKKYNKLAYKISEEFFDCGFSYIGPNCLERLEYSSNQNRYKTESREKVFIRLPYRMYKKSIAILFNLEKEDNQYLPKSATVYSILENLNDKTDLEKSLNDTNVAIKLFTIKISDTPQEALEEQLQYPKNLKMQYHALESLRKIKLKEDRITEDELNLYLISKFNLNSHIVSNSRNLIYQYKLLSYLQETLKIDLTSFINICEELLRNFDLGMKMYGSVNLYFHDNKRKSLKSFVIKALNHVKIKVRIKALQALSKGVPTLRDHVLIIRKLEDNSIQVREEARKILLTLKMDKKNKKLIKKIRKKSRYPKNRTFAKLLLRKNFKK